MVWKSPSILAICEEFVDFFAFPSLNSRVSITILCFFNFFLDPFLPFLPKVQSSPRSMASFASVINLPNLKSISIRLDRSNYSLEASNSVHSPCWWTGWSHWQIQNSSTAVFAFFLRRLCSKSRIRHLDPPWTISGQLDAKLNQRNHAWTCHSMLNGAQHMAGIGQSIPVTFKGVYHAIAAATSNTEERRPISQCLFP